MAEAQPNDFSITRLEQRHYLKRIDDFIVDLSMAIAHMRDNVSTFIQCVDIWQDQKMTSSAVDTHPFVRQREHNILHKGFEKQKNDLSRYGEQLVALQQKVQSVSILVSRHRYAGRRAALNGEGLECA